MTLPLYIYYTHRLIADAFKCLIEKGTDLKVNGFLEYDPSVEPVLKQTRSIILFEISRPNFLLIELIRKLKTGDTKIIIVGFILNNGFVEQVIEAGVDAYVLKSCGKMNLFTAIDQVLNDKKFFCSSITEVLNKRLHNKSEYVENELTVREKEVLKGLVNLKSTKQISEDLNISIATVRTHRKNIMDKFGSKNYIGLLRRACREGLLRDTKDHFCDGCVKIKCKSPLFE